MDSKQQLKLLGLSITPVRLAVLEVLSQRPHADAAQIFEAVQDKLQTTSIQAVYKNLNTLVEHNLVREIKPKGRSSLYEIIIGENHHHLVCRACGLIEDTDCLDSAPCLTCTDLKDFKIDEAEIIFWGLCPACQTNLRIGEKL